MLLDLCDYENTFQIGVDLDSRRQHPEAIIEFQKSPLVELQDVILGVQLTHLEGLHDYIQIHKL